jgi:hypothetical protein
MSMVLKLTQSLREAKVEQPHPPDWHVEIPHDPDSTWQAKIDEYMAQPDHPKHITTVEHARDQAFKDGSWKDDEDIEIDDALEWKFHRVRGILHPEPGEAYSYDEWKAGRTTETRQTRYQYEASVLNYEYQKVNLEEQFRDRGLQVIVKLASVELTPEKPEYSGGSWHLEVSCPTFVGSRNEEARH